MANDYVIGSGLTEQELKAASWWVRHKRGLRLFGFGTLIALSAIFWGFVLWSLLDAYVISYPRESQATRIIQNNEQALAALQASAPTPVQSSEVYVFQNTGERQDFLTEISNPNTQWWADFTYHFDTGSELTPIRQGFILPSSQQLLTEIGWKGQAQARQGTLKVETVNWHRLQPSEIGNDYPGYRDKRLQLTFDNVTYKNDLQLPAGTVGESSFDLHNTSAYGFWAVDVTVVLYRLNTPTAVTRITVNQLKPGETRPISVTWPGSLTAISKTDVRASVNILDPSVYLPSNQF